MSENLKQCIIVNGALKANGIHGMCFSVLCLFHTGNTVLIVAHASSLEACTRQIQGLTPQNSKDFVQVVRKVSVLLLPTALHSFSVHSFSMSSLFS